MPDVVLELPPLVVENLPTPIEEKQPAIAPEQSQVAQEVSGNELLKTPPADPKTAPQGETKPEVSPYEGKSGRHPKNCTCTVCVRSRKIKELVDGKPPEGKPLASSIPQAPWDDIKLPPDLAARQAPPPGGAPPLADPSKPRPDYLVLAKTTFGLSEAILRGVLGDEWKRENDDEMMTIAVPLAAYYEQKGMDDLPVGYVLCFMIATYSMKRVNKPATKSKLQMVWWWVKSKFGRKKKQPETAQPKETNANGLSDSSK